MLIVAGSLQVAPESRDAYLQIATAATRLARSTPGCLDFVQSPDPIEPDRIVVYERWDSEAALLAFRNADPDPDAPELPAIVGADVARYQIASVGPA